MFHVLQISTGYSDGSVERAIIEAAGGRLTLIASQAADDILAAGQDAEGLLVTLTEVSAAVIAGLPKLKLIVRAGIGVDNIALAAAKARGVTVCNLPHYCQDEVADHTAALLLAAERKLVAQATDTSLGKWRAASAYAPIYGLQGKTLGLIGYGGIARKVDARLRPFGLRPVAYDPYLPQTEKDKTDVRFASLDEVLAEADYLSLHLPATDETHCMIDAARLAKMKPTAYLINTARGQLVDNADLLSALQAGRLAGAALDVIDGDASALAAFAACDNVIITPHSAYFSEQSSYKIKADAAGVFADYITKRPLRSIVV